MKKLLLTIILFIFALPHVSFAVDELKLTVVGDVKPYSYATLKLSSSYADLGGTRIAWYHDGELEEEGIGLVTHKVQLRGVGEAVEVTAMLAIPNSGGRFKQTMTLSPALVDTIWEAQTATPPFYRGKALPSHESLIKTMAIAHFGTSTDSTQINYTWKKDKNTGIGSGINIKSSSLFGAWENTSVPVKVTATINNMTANSSVDIPSFKPAVIFYEVSPTQGILTQEILNNNPIRNTVELSIKAIPFGFSSKEKSKSQILYEWRAGNKIIKSGQGDGMEEIFISRGNSNLKEGEINISLSTQNTINVMQYTLDKFSWKFTE